MSDPVFSLSTMPKDTAITDPATGRGTPAFIHYLGAIEKVTSKLNGKTALTPADLRILRRMGLGDVSRATLDSPDWTWTDQLSSHFPTQVQVNLSLISLDFWLRDTLGPQINARLDEIDAKLNLIIDKISEPEA